MRIFTPKEVASSTGSKYLGVLVAAKFGRFMNEFPHDHSQEWEKKLTTRALEELSRNTLKYKIARPRRPAT